jgi:TonB family protein
MTGGKEGGGQDGGMPGNGGSHPSGPSDLRFRLYYQAIWNKIQKSWILPAYNSQLKNQLEAIVILKISRDGTILNIDFEKKSGDNNMDQSVIRALKKASPLPPLPEDFRENMLEVGIRFIPE